MTDSKQPPKRLQPLMHLSHPDAHIPGYEYPASAAPPLSTTAKLIGFVVAMGLAWCQYFLHHTYNTVEHSSVAWPWMIPFALLLGAIATMPFIAKHWWEHHYAKVAIGMGIFVTAYYVFFVKDGTGNMGKAVAEYISFIFLLGSLFVVSGGIIIRVRGDATPMANTILLLIGAIIANIFGTTGAAMLLIRPYLRMNKKHLRMYHVVFFIFIVANAGGSLTPIGDPPLFLGYLQGVPFFWVFEHCWPIWLVVNGILLTIFYVFDKIAARKDDRAQDLDADDYGPAVSFYGGTNLVFITLILVGILGHDKLNETLFHGPWREMLMVIAAFGSLATTPKRVHGENVFNYAPIKEVAFMFVGIFLTMVPALNVLYAKAQEGALPLKTPGQFYFLSGGLSAVLDNAPTYLTFLQTKLGSLDPNVTSRAQDIAKRDGHALMEADLEGLNDQEKEELTAAIVALKKYHGDRLDAGTLSSAEVRVGFLVGDKHLNLSLVAISMGAVLFGAMTYIGNGPNFMVKSIAEHTGAPVPSFFGYVFVFSLPILLPVLILVWVIFL